MPKGRPQVVQAEQDAPAIHKLLGKFGNVSIGPEKASIGFVVDRANIALDEIEREVCGARLECVLLCDPNDQKDGEGQKTLPGIETKVAEIKSVADVPGIGVKPDSIRFKLSFAVNSVDLATLAKLSQKAGRLTAERVGDASDEGEGE